MNVRRLRRPVVLLCLFALGWIAAWERVDAQDAVGGDAVRGRHIATALAGCADCHGAQFAGGRVFMRGGASVIAANLTGGAGGIGAQSDADLRRAIRTGVAPDGTRLRVMPAREYSVMTDSDVNDVIAFLRSLPPIDRVVDGRSNGPAPSPTAPADQSASPDAVRPGAVTGAAYLATIGGCTNCHAANLGGGVGPGGVAAPNISHSGIRTWSFADFQTAMRTGKTPAGRTLATVMPWPTFSHMTDGELRAIYDYLQMQTTP